MKKEGKGLYGLPTPLEVCQDLIVQLPPNDMLHAIEVEQYFFSDEAPITRQVIDGYHINMYLKDAFIEDCKSWVNNISVRV